MVDLIQKNLHHIIEEGNRWRDIIGVEYNRYKARKSDNRGNYIP